MTIKIPSSENILTIELTDLQGRLVKKMDKCSGPQILIQVGDVPKGLYLVKIISNKKIYCSKVIVN